MPQDLQSRLEALCALAQPTQHRSSIRLDRWCLPTHTFSLALVRHNHTLPHSPKIMSFGFGASACKYSSQDSDFMDLGLWIEMFENTPDSF